MAGSTVPTFFLRYVLTKKTWVKIGKGSLVISFLLSLPLLPST